MYVYICLIYLTDTGRISPTAGARALSSRAPAWSKGIYIYIYIYRERERDIDIDR